MCALTYQNLQIAPIAPAQTCTEASPELKRSAADILLDASDPMRAQQQQIIQRIAADTADDRDWRAHGAFTPAGAGG